MTCRERKKGGRMKTREKERKKDIEEGKDEEKEE